ncbi:hypothetical protein [Shimia thalassica]|uniref:hypothetical protein n=1 Tax=Shimia thalassica TaxID=1715693 RepID=UPI0026E2380F|nr:hypothetical protein [Shimia thalassica]MDO6799721.1 hypothetical protein [Shimia thalassica]
MNPQISIEKEKHSIALRFQNSDQTQIENAYTRFEEIRGLVGELIAIEQALLSISDGEYENRFKAIQAMELKLQITLSSATEQAQICREIVLGLESISQQGFPEFQEP